MSFDSRSFSAESWGASWGLTWEANQVATLFSAPGHNAPPLASPRHPQGRKRNLRLENEKVRTRIVRRQEEELLLLL
jgi:hypothetical protein